MHELKQSTGTTILIGPFLDDADGKSPETTIDVTTIDCDLYKGVTKSDLSLTASGGVNDCVHVANGYYSLELTSSNSDTLADGRLTFNVTGAMPFWEDLMIVKANWFDSKCSTDFLQVDVQHIANTNAGADLLSLVTVGYDENTSKIQGVVLTDACTALTGHTAQTGDNFARIGAAGASLSDLGGMSDGMKGEVNAEVVDTLTVDTITDSYVTDGGQPTISQAILAIQQMMQEKSISGTTLTVKKPDGSTSAMTFTLDSATTPTSITRAT